jgi:cyclopropane-fatty-acyl-phospholipid synthase
MASSMDPMPSSHALIAPLPTGLSHLGRWAQRSVWNALENWKHGHLTLELADGTVLRKASREQHSTEHATLNVQHNAFFVRLLLRGEMGAGESFVAGEWDSPDLVMAVRLFLRNLPQLEIESLATQVGRWPSRLAHLLRDNRRGQSERNIHAHYDLGNEFFSHMLDPTMAYSCALFEHPEQSLQDAQRNKFERICQKLRLGPNDHVLEIGCGWGGFALHAVQTRGCRITGITVSRSQYELARQRVEQAHLSDKIEILFRDYRDVQGQYDKIVSIEMLEAVGHAHHDSFFSKCGSVLRPNGSMLVQTISMPDHRYPAYLRDVDWTQRYIFPGVAIPSLSALVQSMARTSKLTVRDLEDIGPHYAPTLRAWWNNFSANRESVRALGFDRVFERTWRMYLAFSEAAFSERQLGDLQIVFAGPDNRVV